MFVSPTVSYINLFFYVYLYIILKASLDFSMIILFYGVYYGVLARDIAEICSDIMASHIGVIKIVIFYVEKIENYVIF